jgi:hypothetical protein
MAMNVTQLSMVKLEQIIENGRRSGQTDHPRYRAAIAEIARHCRRGWTELEQSFLKVLLDDYNWCKSQGVRSQPFLQGITGGKNRQGVYNDQMDYIRRLLVPGNPTDGLQRMVRLLGREAANTCSLEARVLDPRFAELFTEAEKAEARRRLGLINGSLR